MLTLTYTIEYLNIYFFLTRVQFFSINGSERGSNLKHQGYEHFLNVNLVMLTLIVGLNFYECQ